MKDFILEFAKAGKNKDGESLCGDSFLSARRQGVLTAVLSDGMGSGVKANILSTLTSKILGTLLSSHVPLEKSIDTVAATLPVCSVRNMAYATFTALQAGEDFSLYLAEYDNPPAILLRKGKIFPIEGKKRLISGKEITESHIALQEDDILVLCSDGVTSAGLGKTMPEGWGRQGLAEFLERWYRRDSSASHIASMVVQTCEDLSLGAMDDDTTAVVFRLRRPQVVSIMIGPPEHPEMDEAVFRQFFSSPGLHAVCGGTTVQAAARFLTKPIVLLEDTATEKVPAISRVEGIDLATEGALTLSAVLSLGKLYAEGECLPWDLHDRQDGASRIAKLLFEDATHIHILAGQAINPAHTSQGIGVGFAEKLGMLQSLEQLLSKAGKEVSLSLC